MGKIVAIGGGELSELETISIDRKIVELTGKRYPKALFIPTASEDAKEYYDTFIEVYGNKLGCKTDVLYLINETPDEKEIKNKILKTDLIYVGGGNTKKMMEIWEKNKVDKYLKKAWKKDIVLSGLSAGSICWFKYGHSDSESFTKNENEWSYIKVNGLKLINAFLCPHFNEDNREEDFKEMLKKYNETGIALENNSAIIIKNNKYKIITSDEKAKAYKIYKNEGKIITEVIKKETNYNELDKLLTKTAT